MASRQQRGQSFSEVLLILVSVALIAMLGFSAMSSGIGSQSASMAGALAGGTPEPETEFAKIARESGIGLADFDSIDRKQGPTDTGVEGSQSIAFAQGLAAGLIETLREELGALLSPIDTAVALAELGKQLITDFAATTKLLYEELVVKQFDKLVNGSNFDRGFVVGNQVSPFKAVSVLAKVTGASALVGIAKRVEELDDIPRINGRRPRNYRYAGKTHPSGVKFNKRGFPDFSPYTQVAVRINNLTGKYPVDERLANKAAKLDKTPEGWVWHHVEDGRTMQLIPREIHDAAPHTGGSAIIRAKRKAESGSGR